MGKYSVCDLLLAVSDGCVDLIEISVMYPWMLTY